MSTMKISLPDSLKSYVDEQVSLRGYGTRSDYICGLIRQDQERSKMRDMLLKGLQSAPGEPLDDMYFHGLRERAHRHVGE